MIDKIICSLFVLLLGILPATAQNSSVFERFFANAVTFSKTFPREKVHLHLDNSSYYQGDTIWFKAYVVTATNNQLSSISKPLYVELLDQLGNVMERHIIKLHDGEGEGHIALTNAFFTGYYEIRAYTCWMLAFDDTSYFSQTIPIYRKRLTHKESPRSIAVYNMDKSMAQRPLPQKDELEARFYPEGGNLVQGIPCVIGFETVSRDSGFVNLDGFLLSPSGERTIPISTIHDGMGSFMYTPREQPANVEILFRGSTYRFVLPKALPQGYSMSVANRESSFDVTVKRSSESLTDSLALFTFSQGTPHSFNTIEFVGKVSKTLRIMKSDLPSGIVRMSLINAAGHTLCDRFCFSYPKKTITMKGDSDSKVYTPYQKARYKVKVTDAEGKPVRNASVSIAIRDGERTDYIPSSQTIETDLLLTSDLKGYIHQPAYYFEEQSRGRRKLLDNLLLIRGWRQYDITQLIGEKPFEPKQMPEPNLTLYGHVDSWFGKQQSNIAVTVLGKRDTIYVSGATYTDSLGNFSLPMDDMYGRMESVIQTKRNGKQKNRYADVSLYRNFEPGLRAYDWRELHPTWEEPVDTLALQQLVDSLTTNQLEANALQIDEVVVKGKKRHSTLKDTESFERDILAFYNIRKHIDKLRDEGKYVSNEVGFFLHNLNPLINPEGTQYGVNPLRYSVNGEEIQLPYIEKDLDMVETAMLYMDKFNRYAYSVDDNYRIQKSELTDAYTHLRVDTASQTELNKYVVRCAFKMADNWSSNKNYRPSRGIRRTVIQGYDEPKAFYSPIYPESGYFDSNADEMRRTLYWNPNLKTDENGIAVVEYYNGSYTTYMNVCAETLVDGVPASLNAFSYPIRKK